MESEKVKEIKKALECCGKNNPDCDNCPYSVSGGSLCRQPEQDALTLINELEEDKEKWQRKAINYYQRAKSYGIECIVDNDIDEIAKEFGVNLG